MRVVEDVTKPPEAIPPFGARTVTLRARPARAIDDVRAEAAWGPSGASLRVDVRAASDAPIVAEIVELGLTVAPIPSARPRPLPRLVERDDDGQ